MKLPRWLYVLIHGKEPSAPIVTAEQKLAEELASISRMAKSKHKARAIDVPKERALNKPAPRARIRPGTFGSRARFTYTNHKGEVTTREIHNWVSEADYVTGDCQLKGVELTFNKRRIDNWEPL